MRTENSRRCPWLLWKEVGWMHCWRTHIHPTQLTLILSRDKAASINFCVDVEDRSGASGDKNAFVTAPRSIVGTSTNGSSASGTTNASARSVVTDPASVASNAPALDAGEERAHFSHALSQLAELNVDGCPLWPFLRKLEDGQVTTPFPQLRRVRLHNMTRYAKDLRDLVHHIPSPGRGSEDSEENSILVDAAYAMYDDYSGSKLRQICCGKVTVCHPNGTWHALGEKI